MEVAEGVLKEGESFTGQDLLLKDVKQLGSYQVPDLKKLANEIYLIQGFKRHGLMAANYTAEANLKYWKTHGYKQVQFLGWKAYQLADRSSFMATSNAYIAHIRGLIEGAPKDCVIVAITPTYFSQFRSACILKRLRFTLVGGTCYPNPVHPPYGNMTSGAFPGNPTGYSHSIHVWSYIKGTPKNLFGTQGGLMGNVIACCGLSGHGNFTGTMGSFCKFTKPYELPKGCVTIAEDDTNIFAFYTSSTAKPCEHTFSLKQFRDWVPKYPQNTIGI